MDGEVHLETAQSERDVERTRILNGHGLKVIRFKNEEVENMMNDMIIQIKKELIESERSD